MKIVKVSSGNAVLSNLFLRQTPGRRGVWQDCQFVLNQPVEKSDWWFVCHNGGLRDYEETYCDPDHLVYISMEPAESSSAGFLNQFSKLVLCDRNINHPDVTYLNGLTWWVGINVRHENGHHFDPHVRYDYDSFKSMNCPEKKNRISVICSSHSALPGHRKRLAFLDRLRRHPVSRHIDLFGGGFTPIGDKWDAIAPYKYHIVLENSVVPDYWTEKLADAFLGFALPIYYGCPDIEKYFSPRAMKRIDIDDFGGAVAMIEEILERDPYEDHFDEISAARNRILDRYNIFQVMADICREPASRYGRCRLSPAGHFGRSWPGRLARKVIHQLGGTRE